MSRIEAEKTRLRQQIAGIGVVIAVSAIVIWLVVGFALWLNRPTMARALTAFERGDFEAADAIMAKVLLWNDSSEASLLGAKLALVRMDPIEAMELLEKVTVDDRDAVQTLFECADLWAFLGRLEKAERLYRLVLQRDPSRVEANEKLVDLMSLEGRVWEARELALKLFQQDEFRLEHLFLVGAQESLRAHNRAETEYLEFCQVVEPTSPLPRLGEVRRMLAQGKTTEHAKELLKEFVANRPKLVEPQVLLGELLFDSVAESEFLRWHADLPQGAEHHPNIWLLRGRWAHQRQNTEGAIRCLWEAVKRFPSDAETHFLLAKVLILAGRPQDAVPFQTRGDLLVDLDRELTTAEQTPETLAKRIKILEELGRLWEAKGWCHVLHKVEPNSSLAVESLERITSQLAPDSPLTLDGANAASAIDLSVYPIPQLPRHVSSIKSDATTHSGAIAYDESASQVGLQFRFVVDHARMQERAYTFDFAGGGVGILDFDGNGWPDFYFTQSRQWPPGKGAVERKNSLFQNLGGRFVDVAELAGVGDAQFGHGMAVGDFNGDGFPDLYVANLGANTLYLNNGDGTFEDVTENSGTGGDEYTLSTAFADFSGDGLPDLYVVNYLANDTLERPSRIDGRATGHTRQTLAGEHDRLYLNLGDGQFREVSRQAGIELPEGPGKGMGLIVANFDGRPGLDILVANDNLANRLYLNRSITSDDLGFDERGRMAGAAYDGKGRIQGSRGIAIADVNIDGLLDIFVTSSQNEPNNYLAQISREYPPLFSDVSLEARLALPSLPAVGWGAQFLDAELDGDLDLFVANGHWDEQLGMTDPQQWPHMFENLLPHRHRTISAEEPLFRLAPNFSEYSQNTYFGRAVATVDWNRDGLPDLCVTHRDAAIALLTNRSDRRGNFVAIELRGVQCDRDAIGAMVEVETAGRRWVAPLTAGSGFCASNQRQIIIGMGMQTKPIEKLTIHWPQGEPQLFKRLPLDSRWLILQGDHVPHPLPDPAIVAK